MPSVSPVPGRVAGVRKPAATAVGAAVALALGSFGIAVAAPAAMSSSTLSQIKVCVTKSNGKIRYLKQSMADCKDGEALLRWNIRGSDGAVGAVGAAGKDGADGATLRAGSGTPTAGAGADGDFYFDTDAVVLYGPKAAGAWPGSGTSLRGATGATGGTGSTGSAGADGRTILNGVVAPTRQGSNGDFYLNTATSTLYGPKAAGAWPAGTSLQGVSGWERVVVGPYPLTAFGAASAHTASCPSGKRVLGGGYEMLGPLAAAYPGVVYSSNPNGNDGWDVLSTDYSGGPGTGNIKVYAICAFG